MKTLTIVKSKGTQNFEKREKKKKILSIIIYLHRHGTFGSFKRREKKC